MGGVQAVIFDWAGTMVDFGSSAPVGAMISAFEAVGVHVSEAQVRRFMGYAKRDHVIAVLQEPATASRWAQVHGRGWTEPDVDRLVTALEPMMAAAAAASGALIPGAAQTVSWLGRRGVKIGSTTGYTRSMMRDLLPVAADQGYAPEAVVCAGETAAGRPAPFMIWRALEMLRVCTPARTLVVDDAPVGVEAGINAGAWTVGVAASGNEVGLSLEAFTALKPDRRLDAMKRAAEAFAARGADFVVRTVADLPEVVPLIDTLLGDGRAPRSAPTRVLF